jgi:hypothetical protein
MIHAYFRPEQILHAINNNTMSEKTLVYVVTERYKKSLFVLKTEQQRNKVTTLFDFGFFT